MTGYWGDLGVSEPFLLGAPPARYAVSCLECGALIITPRSYDDPPTEVLTHQQAHILETYR